MMSESIDLKELYKPTARTVQALTLKSEQAFTPFCVSKADTQRTQLNYKAQLHGTSRQTNFSNGKNQIRNVKNQCATLQPTEPNFSIQGLIGNISKPTWAKIQSSLGKGEQPSRAASLNCQNDQTQKRSLSSQQNNFKCQSSHNPSGQFSSQQKNRKSLNALQVSSPSEAPTTNLRLNYGKQSDYSSQGMYPPTAQQKSFHQGTNYQINRTVGFPQPSHALLKTKISVDNPCIKISNSEPLPSDEIIAKLLTLPKIQLHAQNINTDQKPKDFQKTRATGGAPQSKGYSTKQKQQQQQRRTSERGRLHTRVLYDRKEEISCDQLLPNRLLTCSSIRHLRSTLNRTIDQKHTNVDSKQNLSQLEPAGTYQVKQAPKIKIRQKKLRKMNLYQKPMESFQTKYGNSFFQGDRYELEPWSTQEEDEQGLWLKEQNRTIDEKVQKQS